MICEVAHVGSVACATMGVMSETPPQTPPAPLHLVLGDEELLVERAVRAVIADVGAADPEVEVRRLRAAEATPADLDAALSPSLFAETRVLVLEAAQEAGKDASATIADHAASLAEGIVLVVQHAGGVRNKALGDALRAAGAEVVRCEWPTRPWERRRKAPEFVRAEVRRAGGHIGAEAVEALVDAVGTDLRELAAAAGQLVADSAGSVDAETVRRFHRGRADASGFAVADKVVAGDRAGALEALRWALTTGVAPVLVADALAGAMRSLVKVAAAGRGDPSRLAGTLGLPPGKIRETQRHLRSWPPRAVAEAVEAAAEANADVKGAATDPGYALERAVLRMCAARG